MNIRYLEYPYADYRGFEHVVDMPVAVAEDWIAVVAEEAGLTGYAWDPSRRTPAGNNTALMNKGAVRVATGKFGRSELWIYNHDGQYSLIQRPADSDSSSPKPRP